MKKIFLVKKRKKTDQNFCEKNQKSFNVENFSVDKVLNSFKTFLLNFMTDTLDFLFKMNFIFKIFSFLVYFLFCSFNIIL